MRRGRRGRSTHGRDRRAVASGAGGVGVRRAVARGEPTAAVGRALDWRAVPEFCRHNRFRARCPICSRDTVEVVSSPSGRGRTAARAGSRAGAQAERKRTPAAARSASRGRGDSDLRVRRVAQEPDDGFRSPLAAGLRSSAAADRLAQEIAFATARLEVLASDPPGLYGEVASAPDREEALWLAFLIAYLGPLDDGDPFAGVDAARAAWADGQLPALDGVPLGARTAHDPARGTATLEAYRAWAERAGSQDAAFAGDSAWSPQRRFQRIYERLALPGLHRDARFDLLVTVGRLGLHELEPDTLALGGADDVTVAAKRVLGIGDRLLLERRAAELADAAEVPLAALDLALWNWGRLPRPDTGERDRTALGVAVEPDADAYARVAAALGL